jgi:hypothetical protein
MAKAVTEQLHAGQSREIQLKQAIDDSSDLSEQQGDGWPKNRLMDSTTATS